MCFRSSLSKRATVYFSLIDKYLSLTKKKFKLSSALIVTRFLCANSMLKYIKYTVIHNQLKFRHYGI